MAVSWEYYVQIALNSIFGPSTSFQLLSLISLIIFIIAGAFSIGIINELYKNYKQRATVETLLFLIGIITLIPSNIFLVLVNLFYWILVLPEIAEICILITLLLTQVTVLCIDLFAIRMTFPKRYKIVLFVLLLLAVINITTQYWATLQGPPYLIFYEYTTIYSIDIQIIRFITLVPVAVIPISVFYYYAVKIREENRAKSNRSLWLGTGILFFAFALLMLSIASVTRIFVILFIPSAIIFYLCFSMPEWFKRRIGWTE